MITAEKLLQQDKSGVHSEEDIIHLMIEFAKLHVEAALKAAEEIAIDFDCEGNYDNSILNCYSLKNIK